MSNWATGHTHSVEVQTLCVCVCVYMYSWVAAICFKTFSFVVEEYISNNT